MASAAPAEADSLSGMSTVSMGLEPTTNLLMRVARPLVCSLAIHLGLGALVVGAGALGMAAHESARVVWLDLEPAEIPPAPPPPPPVVSRPLPAPKAMPRKPAPPPALDEPVAPPPAPPVREVVPEPPPAPSVVSAPPSVAASFKAPEPDQGGASSAASSSFALPSTGAPIDAGANGGPQNSQGPGRAAVASRPPDAAPGGPIVRTARPKGGYQVRPVYPESARRAGIQGTTLLRIHIETDGRVSEVTVERSAGNQSLDQAAADAVRRWRFEPALNSAGPVAMSAVIPVVFRMDDRD